MLAFKLEIIQLWKKGIGLVGDQHISAGEVATCKVVKQQRKKQEADR